VRAGLGLTVLPKEMVPEDFFIIDTGAGGPDLSDTEIALMTASTLSVPAERLATHMVRSLERRESTASRPWNPQKTIHISE
jgi:hypothetical protein